jgi:aminoglycoside 3-N-acetyltransferase
LVDRDSRQPVNLAAHYDRSQLADAMRAVGVCPAAVVFSHSNIGFFGIAREGRTAAAVFETVLGAFVDVLGPEGTLVVPTFTYSFPRGLPYDPELTPSECGVFSEMLRKLPAARRSLDPVYSVAAIGARAEAMTADAPEDSFGPGSFFDRFYLADGFVCNLNFDAGSTLVHYVEKRLRVPYRYDKAFWGTRTRAGRRERCRSIIWVRDFSADETISRFEPFDQLARAAGVARVAAVGRGAVTGISARNTERLIREALPARPWLLTQAELSGARPSLQPTGGPAPYAAPAVKQEPVATLPERLASGLEIVPRVGVGPGVDAALSCIATLIPIALRYWETGARVGNRVVPERWRVRAARLSTTAGLTVAELGTPGFSVPAHSRGFRGRVGRDELLRHTVQLADGNRWDGCLLDANEWGLAMPAELAASLRETEYVVEIDVETCRGLLLGAEAVTPGAGDPLVVGVSLGTTDAKEAARAVAWLLARSPIDRPVRLLIYPEPFSASDLWPEFSEKIVPFGALARSC